MSGSGSCDFFLLSMIFMNLLISASITGFGGAYWLELIGGMLWAAHRVLLRMVLVRMHLLFSL